MKKFTVKEPPRAERAVALQETPQTSEPPPPSESDYGLPALSPKPQTANHFGTPEPPQNSEAEQALLGAILITNAAYGAVADYLMPAHFAIGVHSRIYEACAKLIERGTVANATTLKNQFDKDGELNNIGGAQYLARLAASATSVRNARDYGRMIFEAWKRRELITLSAEVQAASLDPNGELDANGIIEVLDSELAKLTNDPSEKGPMPIGHYLNEAIIEAEAAFKRDSNVSGVTFGLSALDSLTGGAQNGDLIVIAARPSMGKTDLLTNMGAYQAEAGHHVFIAELEMSGSQIAQRLLARRTRISARDQRVGKIPNGNFQPLIDAQRALADLPLELDDLANASLARIRAMARRYKRKGKLDVLLIDYLQRMQWPHGARDENAALGIITNGLKGLAKELGVPVILLAQLNRGVELRDNKRPGLADLRGSGSIEQDADVVIFLYRNEYYLSRNEPPLGTADDARARQRHLDWEADLDGSRGVLELIIGKQRMGPTDTVRVYYDPARSYVCDYNLRPTEDDPAGEDEAQMALRGFS